MKLQKLVFSLLAVAALLAGCKKEEEESGIPNLNVPLTELILDQNGGTSAFTVTSNRDWTVSTDANWLAFNPTSGKASKSQVTVTVTSLKNEGLNRSAAITVSTQFDKRTISVSQPGSKGEDPTQVASGKGTADDPFNVVAALQKAKDLDSYSNDDEMTASNSLTAYTYGIVTSVEIDPSYGNATYSISADGSSDNALLVYRGRYLEGERFTSTDQLKAGDEVIVCGTIVNFNGKTIEYTTGSKIVSLNGETHAPTIDYSSFELISVKSFIDKANTSQYFRLKGKVSRFNASYCSFDLTDDSGTIYVYSVTNKDEWVSKISNGGTVELAGQYLYYEKNSQHEVVNAQILSFEAGSQGGGAEAKGSGTLEDPYNPAGANAVASKLSWTNKDTYETTDNVYVKGKISRIADKGTFTDGGTYGNASFYISEDGQESDEFYAYRILYLGNKKFSSGQTDIKKGDEVVIYGKLMNYQNNTPETVAGKAYLYSLNGQAGEGGSGEPVDYEKAEAKTVAQFIDAADTDTYYKLTGTVSRFNAEYCSFDLTDDSGTIYVYSVANKSDWSSKISNGGTVVLAGKYLYYEKNSQHEVVEAQILSFEAAPFESEDATVAEAIAAESGAVLNVGPANVVASASTGFLMEQDGALLYVYGGKAVVGDVVVVTGKRADYGGAPQLSEPTVTVKSSDASVSYPDAKDINSSFDSYSSTAREYVTFKGKLTVSDKYYNIAVDGAQTVTGSIVKPVEDFSSLNGKEVTVKGYYLYHTSNGKYLYAIATEINGTAVTGKSGSQGGGDQGGGETGGTYSSNVSWTLGSNAYDAEATVNGTAGVSCLKLGTSSKAGTATIVLPKGTKSVSFYGVSWKGKAATMSAKAGDTELFSQNLAANDGASNNSPFTLSVTSGDHYTKTFDSALEADTTVTLTTSGSNTRVILFGIIAE